MTTLWSDGYTNYRAILMLEELHEAFIQKDAKRKHPAHFSIDCHPCWLIARAKASDTFKVYVKHGAGIEAMGKGDTEVKP